MTIIYAAWLGLVAVLFAGVVLVAQAVRDMRQMPRLDNPLLRLKARYDRGEITRDEFERALNEELERPKRRRAA